MQDALDNALDGAKTVLYAAAGRLPFGPESPRAQTYEGLRSLLEAARRHPSLRRILLVSPPGDGLFDSIGEAPKWARAAEEVLRQSGWAFHSSLSAPQLASPLSPLTQTTSAELAQPHEAAP